MNVNDIITLTVIPEICCEECNEIVHNHIDCPECGILNCPTDAYHNLDEFDDKAVRCDNCGAIYQLIGTKWYTANNKVKVKIIRLKV